MKNSLQGLFKKLEIKSEINIPVILVFLKDDSNKYEPYSMDKNDLMWCILSLKHNAQLNPNNIFYLLTNSSFFNKKFDDINNIKIINSDDYIDERIIEFKNNYIHLSTNYEEFEKNCIIRYILLNNFCNQNKIFQFLHLELDILLYTDNINYDFIYFLNQNKHLTLLKNRALGVCFFNLEKFNSLELFTKYVLSTYSNDKTISPKCFDMEKQKIYHQESIDKNLKRGGVSDMHFWSYIYHTNKEKCFIDMQDFDINANNIWQHVIYPPQNEDIILKKYLFKELNIIKTKIIDNQLFGYNNISDDLIRIKYLHFHGVTKRLIYEFTKFN